MLMLLEQVLLGAAGALLGMLGVAAAGQGRSGFGAACLCAACFAGGAAGVAWRFASQGVDAGERIKKYKKMLKTKNISVDKLDRQ